MFNAFVDLDIKIPSFEDLQIPVDERVQMARSAFTYPVACGGTGPSGTECVATPLTHRATVAMRLSRTALSPPARCNNTMMRLGCSQRRFTKTRHVGRARSMLMLRPLLMSVKNER